MLYLILIINVVIFALAINGLANGMSDTILCFSVVSNLLMLGKIALMDKQLKQNKTNSTQVKTENEPIGKDEE